jgi:plasmid stabilization system protein ParE
LTPAPWNWSIGKQSEWTFSSASASKIELRFHPAALNELRKAADYYLIRSPQASQQFAIAVDDALKQILRAPDRFARTAKGDRACRVARIPYQIVYRSKGDVVQVVAVAHVKRRPGYWKHRR